MIVFDGFIIKNKINFICFTSNSNKVEIPIEKSIVDRISKYLNKYSKEELSFNGLLFKNKVSFICFISNSNKIEIPIEKPIADRISNYLDKITLPILNNTEIE